MSSVEDICSSRSNLCTARYYVALRIRLSIDIWFNQSTFSKIGALQVP